MGAPSHKSEQETMVHTPFQGQLLDDLFFPPTDREGILIEAHLLPRKFEIEDLFLESNQHLFDRVDLFPMPLTRLDEGDFPLGVEDGNIEKPLHVAPWPDTESRTSLMSLCRAWRSNGFATKSEIPRSKASRIRPAVP